MTSFEAHVFKNFDKIQIACCFFLFMRLILLLYVKLFAQIHLLMIFSCAFL